MSTEVIRDAVEKLGRVFAENPAKARARSSATASLREGLRFEVVGPRGERIETDMPAAVGGAAAAPSPGWLLRAALASCTASVIVTRAAKLDVALVTLDVTVESESDTRGMLGLDENVSAALTGFVTHVRIGSANADANQLREIVRWADEHSPVSSTLRAPPEIQVEFEVVKGSET